MKTTRKTQLQIAEEIGVDRRTLTNWKQAGIDTSAANIVALKERAEQSLNRKALSVEIAEARLRKLTAEASAKEHQLLVETAHYVTKESQEREGLAAGQLIKQLILKIPAELPQLLVGLEYPEAVKKCESFADHILSEISNLSAITNEN